VTASSGEAPKRPRSRARRRALEAGLVALVVVLSLIAARVVSLRQADAGRLVGSGVLPASASQATHASPQSAPDGSFTTVSGQTMSVASLRGRPTMLWFVVAGCASCAVSVPTVAQHLSALRADGIRVVSLDLYGDLPQGPQGIGQLAQFARETAGPAFGDRDWTWGLASSALSRAYDPSGTPDLYYLLDAGGHIRYQNSAPVSTMQELMAAANRVAARSVFP
jgi:hypothetical protein